MSRSKSPLWLSGTLLVLAYACIGWLSVTWQMSGIRWSILIITTVFADFTAAYLDRLINILFQGVFGVDLRSLFLVMGLATMIVFALTWLPMVSYMALLLAVSLLFSMDVLLLSTNRWQIILLLLIFQATALGLGFAGKMAWLQAVYYWPHLYRMLWLHGV